MFGKILDVGHVRSTTGAVWFYLLSLTVLVGISTTLVHFLGMVGAVDGVGSFFDGGEIHTLIGTAFVILVSGMILSARGMTNDLYGVILAVLGIYISYTTGVMLGLIPIALLTTVKGK